MRAALRLLQERFFCIISWSRPVIAMVVNIPAKNCLKKLRESRTSSKKKTLLIGLELTVEHRPRKSRPIEEPTKNMHRTTAAIMHRVWNISAHTRVFTPPLKV